MKTQTATARQVLRAALEVRRRAGVRRDLPVCVYDLADQLGIEVKFRPETSLEGMYVKGDSPLILISTHRPPGRQAYTCAHEIGHDVFDHGTRVDEFVEGQQNSSNRDPEERLADLFAAWLLMPKPAVQQAFVNRNWGYRQCTAEQIYVVSGYLGVSYEALINQMRWSLGLLSAGQVEGLLKLPPKTIRRGLLGQDVPGHLVVVDTAWVGRTVDIQVGDHILLPASTQLEGGAVAVIEESAGELLVTGVRPGKSRAQVTGEDWAVFIRVQRASYVGRSIFRHLEDPDED